MIPSSERREYYRGYNLKPERRAYLARKQREFRARQKQARDARSFIRGLGLQSGISIVASQLLQGG